MQEQTIMWFPHSLYTCVMINACGSRIPRDILHKVATTLLHSMEGMADLDWEKLLKLQSRDGSFLFSPASTAYALQQTKDRNCMSYLSRAVHKFNGGGMQRLLIDLIECMHANCELSKLNCTMPIEKDLMLVLSCFQSLMFTQSTCSNTCGLWTGCRGQDCTDTSSRRLRSVLTTYTSTFMHQLIN